MATFTRLSQISAASVSAVGVKYSAKFAKLQSEKDGSKRAYQIAEEFLAVLRAIKATPGLTKALTDKARLKKDRDNLLKAILKTIKADKMTIDVMADLIEQSWTTEPEFEHAILEFFFSAMMVSLSSNKDKKIIEKVSAQLFELAETLKDMTKSSSDVARIREFLCSENRSITGRFEILDTIIGKTALPETLTLAKSATLCLEGARFVTSVRRLCEKISTVQNRILANVTVAVPLNYDQEKRLGEILKNKYGQDVELNVLVDEAVLGGMKVDIGSRIIDNTMLNSLNKMEQEFNLTFKV